MEHRFSGEEKIGDIVSGFPGASHVFKAFRIDFCCGGDRSLLEAIRRQELDERAVLARLNESFAEAAGRNERRETDWREAPVAELIDYIVDRHHEYLRKELPVLSEYVSKILRVHGGTHSELFDLHKRFHEMKIELDQHLIAEEELQFPLLKAFAGDPTDESRKRAVEGLGDLEADHRAVGDCLKEIRRLTNGYALPPDACRTFTLAYRKLEELESDLFEHIHLENNVLFPRIAQGLA